ncbi:MAG: SH3 domain-containing protein [Succinivibrio sp.]|nr:SH3 domain-containing protein [Succinivibrio sp.]
MNLYSRTLLNVLIISMLGVLVSSCGGLGIFSEKKVISPEIVGENSNDDHFVSDSVNQKTLSAGKMLDDINSGIYQRLPYGYELIKFPQKFSSIFVRQAVRELQSKAYRLKEKGAVNRAGEIKDTTLKRLEQNCNLEALPQTVTTAYAVVSKKTPVLLYPSNDVWHKDKKTKDRNILHIDELAIGEPVAVLSISNDKRYYFVQSRFNRGWVPVINLAFTRYISWLKFVRPSDFAVVKTPVYSITLSTKDKKTYDYSMGDIILLDVAASSINKPVGLLPQNTNGILSFKTAELSLDNVNVGYLNPTRKNILAQARLYKNLSRTVYSKLDEIRSNSKMFARAYRSIGVHMPLDYDNMKAACAKRIGLVGKTYEQKLSSYVDARPGDLLFFEDDVALLYGSTPRYARHIQGIAAYLYVDSVQNEVDYKKIVKQYDRILVSDLRYYTLKNHIAFSEIEFIGQFFTTNENRSKLPGDDSYDSWYDYDPLYIDELETN